MVRVILRGHLEKTGILELVRLFFGSARETPDGIVSGSSDAPDKAFFDIVSRIELLQADMTRVETTCDGISLSRLITEGMTGSRPHTMVRREIKRQLYECLSMVTGRRFPYGSLTGIRPTRLVLEGLTRGERPDAVLERMSADYGVSSAKSALLVTTAVQEKAVLARVDQSSLLVYLNIPFCPTRCSYCSFICETAGRLPFSLDAYVEAMIEEAAALAPHLNRPVSALYMGGGTPTTLSALQLERLLGQILPHLPISAKTEMTVEAGRPDTIDKDKLAVIHAAGIGRICINPQTLHDQTLVRIGRHHTVEDTARAFRQARAAGFDVINSDLIAGLPGESPSDFLMSVRTLIDWAPENITIHTLSFKRKSDLTRMDGAKDAGLAPDWSSALDEAHANLSNAGFVPYYLYRQKDMVGGLENTGYAMPGTECRYNVGMMSDERMVVGIGAGAMSKYIDETGHLRRLPAPRDLKTYLQTREVAVDVKIRTLFGTG